MGYPGAGEITAPPRPTQARGAESSNVLEAGARATPVRWQPTRDTPGHEAGHRLADLHDPARGRVVRVAGAEGGHRRLGDVVGRGEVRLADLEVDDVAAGRLQAPGPSQHLEGAFGPD